VTIGSKDEDVMIRMALAKGCDSSARIEYPRLGAKTNPLAIAKILAAAIKGQPFDLVLTGATASDDGHGAVGVALAEELGIRHAAMVRKVEIVDGRARVVRELEGGFGEAVEIGLPAALTIQTGTNRPRYAQLLGIRAAQKKELKVQGLADLGLDADEIEVCRGVEFERFYRPEVVSRAQVIEGSAETKAELLAAKIIQAGGL
jgi:electron transfer flavoprotein beta subunit